MPISTIPAAVRQFTVTIQRPPATHVTDLSGSTTMDFLVNNTTPFLGYTTTFGDIHHTTHNITTHAPPNRHMDYPEFYGIALPIMAGLGVLGHLINLVVLNQRYMRSSSTAYFTALCLADILFLVCIVIAYSPIPILWYAGALQLNQLGDFHTPLAKAFIHAYPVIQISQVCIFSITSRGITVLCHFHKNDLMPVI